MPTIYGSLRPQCQGVTFSAISGGSLSAQTLWLSAQARNRAGLNLHSAPVQVNVSAGQRIQVTISPAARSAGEGGSIHEIVISGAGSSSVTQMVRLASIPLLFPDQTTQIALPLTFDLTQDLHLQRSVIVPDTALLPSGTARIQGMVRYVQSLAKYLRYDPLASSGLFPSSPGFWVEHINWSGSPDGFTTYFGASTDLPGGCDRSLLSLPPTDVFQPLDYARDGSAGTPVRFAFLNGLTEDSGTRIQMGEPIGVIVSICGQDVSSLFSGKIYSRYLGLMRRSDGTLDVSRAQSSSFPIATYVFSGTTYTSLSISQEIPRGYSALYEFHLRYRADEIPLLNPAQAIEFYFFPLGNVGTYDITGQILGDVIFPSQFTSTDQRCRILPSPGSGIRGAGAGSVKGYVFDTDQPQPLGIFQANTENQVVALSGTTRGGATIRPDLASLLAPERARALVSTKSGTMTPIAWSSPTTVNLGQALTITVNYPAAIRSNYPDDIAGMTAANNIPFLKVYLRVAGVITEQTTLLTVTPGVTSEQFIISANSGTVVSTLPTSTAEFGLFQPSLGTITVGGGGGLAAGTYEVTVAPHYPLDNDEISAITHQGVGLLREVTQPLVDLLGVQDNTARVTAPFIQPASLSTVTVTVNSSNLLTTGGIIYFLPGGGYYTATAKPSASQVTLQNLGYPENAIAGALVPTTQMYPSGSRGATGANGTNGLNGKSALTQTTSSFTQVNAGFNNTILVADSSMFLPNSVVFIGGGGGYYSIVSIPNATQLEIQNLGYPQNANGGVVIPNNSLVIPAGIRGAIGDLPLLVEEVIFSDITMVSSYANKMLAMDSTAPIILTINTNALVPIPTGTRINLYRKNTGTVTINPVAGVTLNSADNNRTLRVRNSAATLWKQGTNTWYLFGDLAPTA